MYFYHTSFLKFTINELGGNWKKIKLIIFCLFIFPALAHSQNMKKDESFTFTNKVMPDIIQEEVETALSHYPELKDTPIEFRFKNNIRKSFMQAQPKFSGLFKRKKNRSYFILISETVTIDDQKFSVKNVPSDVLIGWLGHELGHIMDYRERTGVNMLWFGIRYITSNRYIKEAERVADTYAVNHGMGKYIIATKDFILNHAHLSDIYKERIKSLYLSQEEIMLLVEELGDYD